jgi:hypothetical protein
MTHQWIALGQEQALVNLGFTQLWHCASTPSLFQIELRLNPYESRCIRDWLARRWQFKSLRFVSLASNERMELILRRPFSALNTSQALHFHESWIETVLADIQNERNSRI